MNFTAAFPKHETSSVNCPLRDTIYRFKLIHYSLFLTFTLNSLFLWNTLRKLSILHLGFMVWNRLCLKSLYQLLNLFTHWKGPTTTVNSTHLATCMSCSPVIWGCSPYPTWVAISSSSYSDSSTWLCINFVQFFEYPQDRMFLKHI